MTPETVGPFSRPFEVGRIVALADLEVEATADECAALAADFNLLAVHSLTGRFRATAAGRNIKVKGRIQAEIEQTCVVTLDAFSSRLDEKVEAEFSEAHDRHEESDESDRSDGTDPIIGGRIDLGALAAEFLALGLDPYPRKPGVAFAADAAADKEGASPFAVLAGLKPGS